MKIVKNRGISKLLLALTVGTATLVALGCCFNLSDASALINCLKTDNTAQSVPRPRQTAVTANGRLEPEGEIATISVPAFLKDERVTTVKIKQGDWVKAGQVLCELDAGQRLSAEVKEAQLRVSVRQAQLAKILAGAKTGEIKAQKAAVENYKSELRNKLVAQEALIAKQRAESQFNDSEASRYSNLATAGAISTSQAESKKSAAAASRALLSEALSEKERLQSTLSARIDEANALLEKVSEVRTVDVSVAQAEVDEAKGELAKKELDLKLAYIRAPKSGRVLKVNIRDGESISNQGIAQIAFTNRMCAIAEVHQSDISKICRGQRATISGDAFNGAVHGTVKQIGWQVLKQRVYAQEPNASSDNRVVEVKIQIDQAESEQVQNLTNLQVEIAIPIRT